MALIKYVIYFVKRVCNAIGKGLNSHIESQIIVLLILCRHAMRKKSKNIIGNQSYTQYAIWVAKTCKYFILTKCANIYYIN